MDIKERARELRLESTRLYDEVEGSFPDDTILSKEPLLVDASNLTVRSALLRMEAEEFERRLTLPVEELAAAVERLRAQEKPTHEWIAEARRGIERAIRARDDAAEQAAILAEMEQSVAAQHSLVVEAEELRVRISRLTDEDA